MADPDQTFLTIENDAGESSTCTEAMDHNGEASTNLLGGTQEGMRVPGGVCESSQPPVDYPRNILTVRSGELPPVKECVSSCPYGRNYQAPSCSGQQQAYCYQPQRQECDYDCPRRAHRTASSHYMEYKEFKPTDQLPCAGSIPLLRQSVERTCSTPEDSCSFPVLRRSVESCALQVPCTRRLSESSCGSRTPPRRPSVESCSLPEPCTRRLSQNSCGGRSPTRRHSVESCSLPRPRRQPESSCGGRTPTPCRQSVEVRCSHQTPPIRRQRQASCGSRTSARRQSVGRSCSSQRPPIRRQSQACGGSRASARRQSVGRSCSPHKPPIRRPSEGCGGARAPARRQSCSRQLSPPPKCYYMGKRTPAAQTHDVRQHARSHVHGSCQRPPPPPPPCRRSLLTQRSASASSSRRCSSCDVVVRNPITRSNCNYSTYEVLPHGSCRSRSPSCGSRPPPCRRPLYSNETLMEKPVQTYRFTCPENRKCPKQAQRLCPKCHREQMLRQRSASTAKRCAAAGVQKYCARFGFMPMMPHISIPNMASSNRCIYQTLSKPFKTKYELTLCCGQRRCKGGKTCHHLVGTIATNIKKRSKFIAPGGHSVSPTRTSMPRSSQAPSIPARVSHIRRGGRSSGGHHEAQTAAKQSVPKRRNSDSLEPMSGPARTPSPPPHHRHRTRSPEAEIPSSTRRHRSHAERSHHRERNQEQEQEHEQHRHNQAVTQSRSQPDRYNQAAPPSRSQTERSNQVAPQYQTQPERSKPAATQPKSQPDRSIPGAPQSRPQSRSQPERSNQAATKPRSQPERSNPGAPESQPERSNQVASQSQSQPEPSNQVAPPTQEVESLTPTATQLQMTPRQQRAATFLGTEINPFYRGSFLRTRSSRECHLYHSPIQRRTQELREPPTLRRGASSLMPPKWTGLGQLQSWVFGDSFIGAPVLRRGSHNGTWSWRQIFGRSKKGHRSKSEVSNK